MNDVRFSRSVGVSCLLGVIVGFAISTGCSDSPPTIATTGREDAGTTADAGHAVPITVGEGAMPGLAVDRAGTAYMAWNGPEPVTSSLQFCRLPRGARACDVRRAIPALGTSLSRPFVTVSGSSVAVVSYRYGLTGDRFDVIYLYRSTDGGATFDEGRQVGTVPFHDAVQGPGDSVSLATDAYSFGEVFESVPLDATTAPPTTRAVLSVDHPYGGAVGLIDAATPLVVFTDVSGNAQFRRYVGSGSSNDVTNWSVAQEIGHGEYMHLAGGPTGLFLLARSAVNTLEVRRFDGSTFGPGISMPEGKGELPQSHLSQDEGGRLHAVWPRIDVDGTRLYHAASDDGVAWQSGLVHISPDNIASMRVAASADHIGVAVWQGPSSAIRVAPVGPSAPAK